MPDHMRTVSEDLLRYLRQNSLRESDVQRRLREETDAHPEASFAAAPEQSQFLGFLVELIGARKVLEVGVFTGCSTLAMAMALPDDGTLIACDMIDDYIQIGAKYWAEAGVDGKIDVKLGPARETLDELIAEGLEQQFDLALIDANKKDYDAYYERALVLVRPGGLIALDNMFWYGAVLDESKQEKSTRAIRALNSKLHGDSRVSLVMLPIEDGMTLLRKRP